MIIFSIVNFVTGIVLISTAFFYRKRAFECKAHGLLVSEANCLDYVCDLPKDQWKNYFALDDNSFDSLASGEEFYCDNHALVDMLSSFTYFGAFLGYLVISFFADNWGRRTSLLLGWGIETLGAVVVASSVNIYMASAGLFMCGFGADVCINIAFFFFGEVVGD
jgi:MFS family permease